MASLLLPKSTAPFSISGRKWPVRLKYCESSAAMPSELAGLPENLMGSLSMSIGMMVLSEDVVSEASVVDNVLSEAMS